MRWNVPSRVYECEGRVLRVLVSVRLRESHQSKIGFPRLSFCAAMIMLETMKSVSGSCNMEELSLQKGEVCLRSV